jgi:hypothetical protein
MASAFTLVFARGRAKRSFLMSNISQGNTTLCYRLSMPGLINIVIYFMMCKIFEYLEILTQHQKRLTQEGGKQYISPTQQK